PKMIGEARLAAGWLKENARRDPLVIYLYISKSDILKRTGKRRIFLHGRLVKRDDDNLKALKNRERYYRKEVSRVVKFFRKRYEFARISGGGGKRVVWTRIMNEIKKHEKRHG